MKRYCSNWAPSDATMFVYVPLWTLEMDTAICVMRPDEFHIHFDSVKLRKKDKHLDE